MIDLKVKELREALRGFSKLNLSGSSLPVLQHVHCKASKDGLTLSATDLDQTLTYRLEAGEPVEGECLIPFSVLRDTCKSQKSSTVVQILAQDENGKLLINDRYHTTGIPFVCGDLSEYPAMAFQAAKRMDITSKLFRSLQEAEKRASDDPSRHVLNSIRVSDTDVVATNGRHLYYSNSYQLPVGEALLIPRAKALSLFKADEPGVLSIGEVKSDAKPPVCRIEQGPWTWTFAQVPGDSPNWKQVLPAEGSLPCGITLSEQDSSLFTESLCKLPFMKKEHSPAGLKITGGKAYLFTGTGEGRNWYELSPVKVEAPGEAHIGFDFSYFVQGIRDGMRQVHFKDPYSPLTLSDEYRKHIIMPINLRDEVGPPVNAAKPVVPSKPMPTVKPAPKPESPPAKAACEQEGTQEKSVRAAEALLNQVGTVRQSLRQSAAEFSQLLQLARDAIREYNQLDREHAQLKRSVKSIQQIDL